MSLTTAKSTSWMKSTRWRSQGPSLSQLQMGRLNVREEEKNSKYQPQISGAASLTVATRWWMTASLRVFVCV